MVATGAGRLRPAPETLAVTQSVAMLACVGVVAPRAVAHRAAIIRSASLNYPARTNYRQARLFVAAAPFILYLHKIVANRLCFATLQGVHPHNVHTKTAGGKQRNNEITVRTKSYRSI